MSTLHQRARAFHKGADGPTGGTRQPVRTMEAPTSAIVTVHRVIEASHVGGDADE